MRFVSKALKGFHNQDLTVSTLEPACPEATAEGQTATCGHNTPFIRGGFPGNPCGWRSPMKKTSKYADPAVP